MRTITMMGVAYERLWQLFGISGSPHCSVPSKVPNKLLLTLPNIRCDAKHL